MKSCLKALEMMQAKHIIHEVTFMGGAVDRFDKPKHNELWQRIFSSPVPGLIKNVFTKCDYVLLTYTIS
jgi:hypothetical protein